MHLCEDVTAKYCKYCYYLWLDLPLRMQSRNRRCKTRERNAKVLHKELPYFDLKGNLPLYH